MAGGKQYPACGTASRDDLRNIISLVHLQQNTTNRYTPVLLAHMEDLQTDTWKDSDIYVFNLVNTRHEMAHIT